MNNLTTEQSHRTERSRKIRIKPTLGRRCAPHTVDIIQHGSRWTEGSPARWRRPKVCNLGRQKPLVTVKNESGNKCGSSSYQPKVTVFVNTVYCNTEELDISGPEDFVELPCFEGALEESSSFRDLSFFV